MIASFFWLLSMWFLIINIFWSITVIILIINVRKYHLNFRMLLVLLENYSSEVKCPLWKATKTVCRDAANRRANIKRNLARLSTKTKPLLFLLQKKISAGIFKYYLNSLLRILSSNIGHQKTFSPFGNVWIVQRILPQFRKTTC